MAYINYDKFGRSAFQNNIFENDRVQEGHLSILEKDYDEFKLHNNKQSVEEILIRTAVKTTIQTLYDLGIFFNFHNACEVLKSFLLVERRRPDLEELNDVLH